MSVIRSEAPQPFQYQGSKRSLAKRIVEAIPDSASQLVEPFAGSAAVTLAAAYYGRVGSFLVNDVNEPLVDLWRAIVHEPDDLVERYSQLWHDQQIGDSRDYYDLVRDRFNTSARPAPADMLYLLSRAVKGAVRYNSAGAFNQSPDKRRLGTRPATLRRRFRQISVMLSGRCTFSSADYLEVLANVNGDSVIYMDPPYEGVSGSRDTRYSSGLERDSFMEALAGLTRRGVSFILSYDGRTGSKTYGDPLPTALGLTRIDINVGRSASATLLGRAAETVEALYLSQALVDRGYGPKDGPQQMALVDVGSGGRDIQEGAE